MPTLSTFIPGSEPFMGVKEVFAVETLAGHACCMSTGTGCGGTEAAVTTFASEGEALD